MYEILNKINSPKDVKKLSIKELNILAQDVREALFNRLSKIGGHFGPNFGIVETVIAMHYVFSSPKDKFVFDVSHQCYTHKILTGRKLGFIDDKHFGEISGYTNPEESEHDLFTVGHTSTSISLATGLAKARDLKGGKENVIALIGDGSLSGGEALEGLNVAGSELESNLIIIVNDNQQSISETHGGIYKSLKDLRESNGQSENNFFKTMGLDYVFEKKGNDIESLINVFQKVKDHKRPIVVHLLTQKGKGYQLAEQNKEAWHWTSPFDRETGNRPVFSQETYASVAKQFILDKAKKDKNFVVITPNMPSSVGLSPLDRKQLGKQFVDVGIAEEQAVAMASGLAKGGAKPIVVTNVTFLQRCYDQISQDVCINNSPITILLNYSSFAGLTDVTHLGIFGISAFSNIPNLQILCPTCKSEFVNMLDYSTSKSTYPTMIFIPGNGVCDRKVSENFDQTYFIEQKGKDVAILALGNFFEFGGKLKEEIEQKLKIKPTLINPRYANIVDKKTLDNIAKTHKVIITLEDGILDGGFGQKIATYLSDRPVKVKCYGLERKFYDRYDPQELLKELKITNKDILKYIQNALK